MICRRLGFCLAFQAAVGGGPAVSVPRAAAEGGHPSLTATPAAGETSSGYADAGTGAEGGWRRVPCATTAAGKGCAAILHTADFNRSDPRLAGVMLRCGVQEIETVLVVVEPFPPHALPQVTLRTPEQSYEFASSSIPTGAGIRLLMDPAKLIALGREVEVKVINGGSAMDGIVDLAGLPKALAWLNFECDQK